MDKYTNNQDDTNQNAPKQETGKPVASQKSFQGSKVFIGVIVLIAVVVGTMYYISVQPPKPVLVAPPTVSPDTVLATVNGEEIIQQTINDRLAEAGQALVAQGININDPNIRAQIESQIIEDTINYTLLKQASINSGSESDPEALEEMFQTFVVQAGGSDQLLAQLQQVGLTEESFRERLAEQMVIDSYLNDNSTLDEIVVTEEEITTAYNLAVENAGGAAIPPLSDVRDQIEQQIIDQKRQEIIVSLTDELRVDAVIERN